MGCIPCKKTSTQVQKINTLQELKIQPGLFVRANPKSFQQVYTLGNLIGTGGYGQVRKIYARQTGSERAVKIYRKQFFQNDNVKTKMIQQIFILRDIDHINIIRLYQYFQDEKRIYLVMQHCQGGELFDQIIKRQNFNEFQAAQIMKQLFSSINYIHQHGIMHRDLKPQNILLEQKGVDSFNIKLIDFGKATKFVKNQTFNGVYGTPYYIAPEVFSGSYTEKSDIWSCGVIMYILLSGSPPFDGKKEQQITGKVKKGKYNLQQGIWKKISENAKNLIKSLMCPASRRLEAHQAMNHPWITQNNGQTAISNQQMDNILTNLRGFTSTSKLRDAVHTYIATQCVQQIDIKELREAFREIDVNGDGRLSRQELLMQYSKSMGAQQAQQEVNRIMDQVDTDQNGFIDYTEFVKATMDIKKAMSAENLRIAFNLFDQDGSGSISAQELKKVLQGVGESENGIWNQIVIEVDRNGDGEIDLHEFEEIVMRNVSGEQF